MSKSDDNRTPLPESIFVEENLVFRHAPGPDVFQGTACGSARDGTAEPCDRQPADPVLAHRLKRGLHIVVRAKINGKGPFNFILDTGAPALFVATKVAENTINSLGGVLGRSSQWTSRAALV